MVIYAYGNTMRGKTLQNSVLTGTQAFRVVRNLHVKFTLTFFMFIKKRQGNLTCVRISSSTCA